MKMNVTQVQEMVVARANEIREQVIAVSANTTLAESTKGTKAYGLRRDRRVLQLIEALVAQIPGEVDFVSEGNYETFLLLTRMEDEKARAGKFYLVEGETIVQVMERYPNKRNLMKAITEYCEANGLMLDSATMTIVAAE